LLEQLRALKEASQLGPILDLACGRGRHALALAERGVSCLGADRNEGALSELREHSRPLEGSVAVLQADLEAECGVPLKTGSCGAILVFRFLFRPVASAIESALVPGGLLLYETFTVAQLELGYGPRSRNFLLEPRELPGLFPGLEVLDYWEGTTAGEHPEALARLLARRPQRAR
jgi:SAM-dependent methyltransferase